MTKSKIKFSLFLSTFLLQALASNLIVDPSSTSPPAGTYTSLRAAISALMDATNTMNGVNTITLKESCLFVPQTLPDEAINGNPNGSSSLSITFENPPASLNDSSNCSQLPTLALADGSYFSFTTFSSITITGLNILYNGDTYQNSFTNVSSVKISQFCFNNSEPQENLTSGFLNSFLVTSSSEFTMIDGIYLFDAFKSLSITQTPQVTIQQVLFIPLLWIVDEANAAINLTGDSDAVYNLNVSAFQIVCSSFSTSIIMSEVFLLSNMSNIWISEFNITNCNFNAAANNMQHIIQATQCTNLSIDSVNVFNLYYGWTGYQAFLYVSAVTNTTLSNFYINNLTLVFTPYYVTPFILYTDNITGQSNFTFSGWYLTNSSITEYNKIIYATFYNYFTNYGGFTFQNMTVYNCLFYGAVNFLNLQIGSTLNDSLTYPIYYVNIQNFSLVQTKIEVQTDFFYTDYNDYSEIKSLEIIRYEVSNFTMIQNNVATTSNIFHTEGVTLAITNFTLKNNSFNGNSNFIFNENRLQTVFLTNGIIHNVTLSTFSVLVNTNMTTARDQAVEASYDHNGTGIYAETKPYIVHNCSFMLVNMSTDSYLLASTSPTTLIRNNSFTNIYLNESGIFKLGNYEYFASDQTLFVQYWNSSYDWHLKNFTVFPFTASEIRLFHGHQSLHAIYNNSRNTISSYDPSNTVFFVCMQENVINTVQAINSPGIAMLYNFEITNGTIFMFNNTFSNLTSNGSSTDVFEGTTLDRGFFLYNNFTGSNFNGYAFGLSSTQLQSFLLNFNQLIQVQNLGFLSVLSTVCQNISLQSNQFENISISTAFASIECNQVNGQLLLQGSFFYNISLLSDPNVLEDVEFFSIAITEAIGSTDSLIQVQDNIFSSINVSIADGYSQGVYQGSFISMLSVQCTGNFSNNTFDTLAVNPQGNIMNLALPNIIIFNSTFSNLLFGSPNGAFNLVLEELSIANCSFNSNQNYNPSGDGLFRLVNPKPASVVLAAVIQYSSFSNNLAPSSTIFSTQGTKIQFQMTNNKFINNQVTVSGSFVYFSNVSASNITVVGLNVTQNPQGTYVGYQLANVISFAITGANVTLTLQNISLLIQGPTSGNLILIDTDTTMTLQAINLTYLSVPSSQSQFMPMFGLLNGNNFQAYFEHLLVDSVVSAGTPFFTINSLVLGKINPQWNLTLDQSTFKDLILTDEIISVSSDANASISLDNFHLMIENSIFSNITWQESSGGVISILTSSLGRGRSGSDFAVTIQNASFASLYGSSGLIYNGFESLFGSLLWMNGSSFVSINGTGTGAILSPATTLLSSYQSGQQSQTSITQNNASFKITGNLFSNISAQAGTILYWQSQVRGISLFTVNNRFTNISSSQAGGLFYTSYAASTSSYWLSEDFLVIMNSTNDTFNSIYAQSGAIVYAQGATQLLRQVFTLGSFKTIQASTNGSIFCINSAPSLVSARRILLSSGPWPGNISLIANTFQNISAQNGAIIYESTINKTLIISAQSNTFSSIYANQRGGICFLNDPTILFNSNIFTAISAQYAGNLIFSLSDDINISNFAINNVVNMPQNSNSLFSFAPTNLKIQFFSLNDSSDYPLQYENIPPYNPTVPNLTSFSLSQFLINLTLVYQGQQGTQIVYDNSQGYFMILTFSTMTNTNPQNYWTSNCSNSTCTALPSTIVLTGNAGDLILVNATYESDAFSQFQQFYIRLRSCVSGEINDTINQECVYCGKNTYSLVPTDESCTECPLGAICQGGALIYMQAGYWRSNASNDQLLIVQCNDTDNNCLGGYDSACSDQSTGPACLQCNIANNYMSTGQDKCSQCASKKTLIASAILTTLASIVYQLIVVIITFRANKVVYLLSRDPTKPITPSAGAFMVILTTFSQVASLLNEFDTGYFDEILSVSVTVGNTNKDVVTSSSCLYYVTTLNIFRAFQFEILFFVLSPVVKLGIVILFETAKYLITCLRYQTKENAQRRLDAFIRIGAAAVVLVSLEQPGIVGILCDYIVCSTLDPNSDAQFVKTRANIQCGTDDYNSFKNNVIVPLLVLWAFLIPACLLGVLYFNKDKLWKSKSLRLIFGNLYNFFKKEGYYWGVVIIFFKTIIFVVNSVLTTRDTGKGLFLLALIGIYYLIFQQIKPYIHPRLYGSDKFSSIGLMFSLLIIFFKKNVDDTVFQNFCNFLIMISFLIPGGYLVVNICRVYLQALLPTLRRLKQKCIRKKENRKKRLDLTKDARRSLQGDFERSDISKNPITIKPKEDSYIVDNGESMISPYLFIDLKRNIDDEKSSSISLRDGSDKDKNESFKAGIKLDKNLPETKIFSSEHTQDLKSPSRRRLNISAVLEDNDSPLKIDPQRYHNKLA